MTIIQTSGGEFVIETLEPYDARPDEIVHMRLRFEANASVDATDIGFIQVARVLVGGKPYISSPLVGARSIPPGEPDAGASVDCADEDYNPVYGLTLGVGMANGADLTQGEVPPNLDVVIGQHPFGGGDDTVHAVIEDYPEVPIVEGDCSMIFETAALVLAGPQAPRYLGAIRWTWHREGGVITTPDPTLPPKPLQKGVSQMFRRAVQCWNAAAEVGGALPIPW